MTREFCIYDIGGVCFDYRCFKETKCTARTSNGCPNFAISNGYNEEERIMIVERLNKIDNDYHHPVRILLDTLQSIEDTNIDARAIVMMIDICNEEVEDV